jgi:uncharacterized DUF497 family protein
MIRFEWDDIKAEANLKKHGVSFEDATYVFENPDFIMEDDRVVDGEMRWHTTGMVGGFLLLLVVHTLKDVRGIETVRIISARQADRRERLRYDKNRENDTQ